jgi:hypothetical protein
VVCHSIHSFRVSTYRDHTPRLQYVDCNVHGPCLFAVKNHHLLQDGEEKRILIYFFQYLNRLLSAAGVVLLFPSGAVSYVDGDWRVWLGWRRPRRRIAELRRCGEEVV